MTVSWRIATYLEPVGGSDEGAMHELACETFSDYAADSIVARALERHASKMKSARSRIAKVRRQRKQVRS